MKFFKPEDFSCLEGILNREDAAVFANAKLEREGKVVYSGGPLGSCSWDYYKSNFEAPINWHKALLINIEPVETCKHPKEKIKYRLPHGFIPSNYECECGAKVQPKEFEEIQVTKV